MHMYIYIHINITFIQYVIYLQTCACIFMYLYIYNILNTCSYFFIHVFTMCVFLESPILWPHPSMFSSQPSTNLTIPIFNNISLETYTR